MVAKSRSRTAPSGRSLLLVTTFFSSSVVMGWVLLQRLVRNQQRGRTKPLLREGNAVHLLGLVDRGHIASLGLQHNVLAALLHMRHHCNVTRSTHSHLLAQNIQCCGLVSRRNHTVAHLASEDLCRADIDNAADGGKVPIAVTV